MPGPYCCRCGLEPPAGGARECIRCPPLRPVFEVLVIALRYRWPVREVVIAGKYRGDFRALSLLSTALAEAVLAAGHPLPDVLIPVPLHWARGLLRGYNQAGEIARLTGKALGIPVQLHELKRTRVTKPQARLDRHQRADNVVGAFAARTSLRGRVVGLVDDVMTTGCTAQSALEALRQAGCRASQMWVSAIADQTWE